MAELLEDDQAWQQAREAGIARVEAEYTEALMLSRYRQLYVDAGALPGDGKETSKDGGDRLRTA